MALVFLVGGARSGKSELAARLAEKQSAPVTVIATGEPGDEEMAARIEQHRRERPADWDTVEEPLELADALAAVPSDRCAIVDCLTLWTANMLAARGREETEDAAVRAATAAARRSQLTVAVSNEVGFGIVPENPLGREYRDLLGRVNAAWAAAAERTYLLVAGRALELAPPERLIEELR